MYRLPLVALKGFLALCFVAGVIIIASCFIIMCREMWLAGGFPRWFLIGLSLLGLSTVVGIFLDRSHPL